MEVQDNLFGKDTAQHRQDTDIPNDYHHEDMDNFENAEEKNHTNLGDPYLGPR